MAIELVVALAFVASAVWAGQNVEVVNEQFENAELTGVDIEQMYAIVAAYRRVLERPPTEDELQRARHKIGMDPDFDIPALEIALRGSEEYRRLVGIQKNVKFSELGVEATESMIRGKLYDMYKSITGNEPDGVTMDFLYSRYRHTNLSDAYVTALIQQMAANPARASHGGVNAGKTTSSRSPAHSAAPAQGQSLYGRASSIADSMYKQIANGLSADGEDDSTPVWARVLTALGVDPQEVCRRPELVEDKLRSMSSNGTEDSRDTEAYRKKLCRSSRNAMLESIGYDSGKPIGSWTMPQSMYNEEMRKTRSDGAAHAAAMVDQTELIGLPLAEPNPEAMRDTIGPNGKDMVLF